MTLLQERLSEAIEAKKNDVESFVWKLAKNSTGVQEEVKLMDATPEQLQTFYDHCYSMLYSTDKVNPGRYPLLKIIAEQRRKCNVELFLRALENGSICADHKGYPRFLYLQNIRTVMDNNKDQFPRDELRNISIAAVTGGLPREFERISIEEVIDGCLNQLGQFSNKHLTFPFILNLGVFLSPQELRDFDEKDDDGSTRKKPEVIKERLGLKSDVRLKIKQSGLSYKELRAMINLRSKNYSELTTDQLTTLRNKVLFRLEDEVRSHIESWNERIRQIEKVAEARNIELKKNIPGKELIKQLL